MLTNISNKKNESLILELSDGADVGTIGGYCEDGFPIYYANNKIAHMLGYDDVDDFIAGIHGMVANTIHPDDMERVVKELNNGEFYEGMTYKVTYRMPRKDGTSIWTVDKGKVIRAEDGRLAIISICNDMTAFIDHHAELERLNKFSKSTLENMPGGYHRCAAEEGYPFLYISDRFCEMFGWTREEIQTEFDNKFINMLYPEDKATTEKYVSLLNQRSNENVVDAIYRMKGKNGYIWVSDATSLVSVGDEIFYQGTLTDITGFVVERKKQDELLREQLNVFDSLARGFQNVFWINLTDGTAKILKLDGYITSGLDKNKHKFFDYPTTLKQYINERVHPEDKQTLYEKLSIENLRKIFEKRNEYIGNYRALVNGEVHHYQYNLTRTEGVGFITCGFQNIDAIVEEHELQVKREKALEAARLKGEREHAEVVNSLSTIYSTIFSANIDTGQYNILTSEPLMDDIAERSGNVNDVKDKIIESFMAPEFRNLMYEFLDLNTLAERLQSVNTIKTEYKALTDQWMQSRFIVKRRDEDGTAKEVLYVVRDITKEKLHDLKQQEALAQALAAAQQANTAKTTFLNSMSHDIRTPMNAIIGFTALAQTHSDDLAQVRDYLGKISTSSTHLLNLINDVLDMSRIESGTMKLDETEVHLPDLLQDLRTMIQSLIDEKNQNLFIEKKNVVHEDVLTDKLRLNQILLNIVGNAIKFTQPGGDIVIRLIEKPCSLRNYTTYEFSIRDNGIGMSKEYLGHIFETFTREYSATVSGVQGTGLGMAITKNLVDMMGGDIRVESVEGKGSIFTVTLNLRISSKFVKNEQITEQPPAKKFIEQENVNKAYDYSGKRVLLVEDNELNQEIATAILEDMGMTVDIVNDGDIAVSAINKAPSDKYDFIFMDIQMPKMDGYTATREIRTLPDSRKANIPIIAMTANAFEEDKRKSYESGMNGHIIKPISIEAIAQVLDEIFAK